MVPNILLVAGDKMNSLAFSRVAEELTKKDKPLSLNLLLGHGKPMKLAEEELFDFVDNADVILIGISHHEYTKEEIFVTRRASVCSKKFGFYAAGGSWRKPWLNVTCFQTSFIFVGSRSDVSEAKKDFPKTTKIIQSGLMGIEAARIIANYLFEKALEIETLSIEV